MIKQKRPDTPPPMPVNHYTQILKDDKSKVVAIHEKTEAKKSITRCEKKTNLLEFGK